MIKLSIITITRNNLSGLQKTLDTVLPQLTDEIELIVIDGDSTDGTKEYITAHSHKISKWRSEKDAGIYFAQNKGLALAEGEYCLFLNAGDYFFENNTLAKVLPHLNEHDIVYGNMKIYDGNQFTDGVMPDTIDLQQMMVDTIWHPVSFIKRTLFTKYGEYNTKYKICADYDFFFKVIIAKHCKCRHLHQFIVVFELGGLSSNAANVSLIQQERASIQATYLSWAQLFVYNAKDYLSSQLQRVKRWFR